MDTEKAKDLINWAELSRSMGYDRSAITRNRIPAKHAEKINRLIQMVDNWAKNHGNKLP
jgi:hypothetical protein